MELDKKTKNLIDEILENFDFESCHKMMMLTNWTWHGAGVPNVERLKNSAVDRILSAINVSQERWSDKDIHIPDYSNQGSSFFSSSGGLKATVWTNKGDVLRIDLEFIFTEWTSEFEET